jgi:hypothetical protein
MATIVKALEEGGWDPDQQGSNWVARCPAHGGEDRNLHFGVTSLGKVWLACKSHECDGMDVLDVLGLHLGHLYPDFDPDFEYGPVEWDAPVKMLPKVQAPTEATYEYVNADGSPNGVVYRRADKTFSQFARKGRKGEEPLVGRTLPLYHLDRLEAADPSEWAVTICAGEKDADNMIGYCEAHGGDYAPVTTTPGGETQALRPEWIEPLRKFHHVVVIPDRDIAGLRRAEAWGATGLPVHFRLPKQGKDWSDHMEAGLGADDLEAVSLMQVKEMRRAMEAIDWEEPWPIDSSMSRPALPLDVIPEPLRSAVVHVARDRQVVPDIVFVSMLTVASGAWAEHATVRFGTNWIEPLNIYTLAIAESGDAKSPALKPARILASEISEARQKEYHDKAIEARRKLIDLKQQMKGTPPPGGGAAIPPGNMGDLLREQEEAEKQTELDGRCITTDVTPEAMAVRLSKSGGLAIIIDDEGLIIHHAIGMYSKTPNIALLLKGWEADTYWRDRISDNGRSVYIPRVLMAICCTIQPGVAARFFNDRTVDDRGLLSRFLTVWPGSMYGHRMMLAKRYWDSDRARVEPWSSLVVDVEIQLHDNELPMFLGKEASRVFAMWHDKLERRVPEMEGRDRKAMPKMRAYALRIAGLLHLIECHESNQYTVEIDATTVQKSIALMDYFQAHLAAIDGEANPGVVKDAFKIMDWLVEGGHEHAKVSEIARGSGFHRRAGDSDRVIRALTLLMERGWVAPQDVRGWQNNVGRGNAKRSPVIQVYPLAFSTYEHTDAPGRTSVSPGITGITDPLVSRRRRLVRVDPALTEGDPRDSGDSGEKPGQRSTKAVNAGGESVIPSDWPQPPVDYNDIE